MKRIIIFLFVFTFLNFFFFRVHTQAESKGNPFTIDAKAELIIEKYVVLKGDTLSEIGAKYNVSIQELSKYNNFKGHHIYVGQKVLIPLKQKKMGSVDNEKKETAKELIRQGNENRDQQNYEKAIEFFNDALNLDPYNLDALYGIGFSNLKTGLYHKAIESFIKAVKIDPYNPISHYNLGLVYFHLKQKEPAFEQYKILKTLNGKYATRLLIYLDSLR
ncbi:MAG: tetratricopeptide repeat protein [Candidatus Zixiibacteriota bacterium]